MKNIFKTKQCKIISLLLGTIGIITPISFTTTSCSQTKIELGSLDNKVLTPQFLFYAHDPSKVTGQELQNMNSSLNLELAIQNEIKQATGVTVDFSDFFLQNLGVPGSNYDGGPDGLEFHSILFVIHASSNSKILTGQRQFTALARATAVMPYDISLASAYLRNDIHVLCTDTEDPHLVDKEHIIKDVNNSSILQRSIIDAINKGSGKHISNEDYDLVFLTNLPDKPIDVSEFMPIQIQIVSKSDNKNMIAGKMQTEILFKVIKNSLPDISSLPHSFTDTLVISSLTPTFVSSDDIVQLQIKIDTFISDTIFAAFQNRFTNQYSWTSDIQKIEHTSIYGASSKIYVIVTADSESETLTGNWYFAIDVTADIKTTDISNMTAFSITSSIDKPVGDFTKVPKDVFASINKDANTLDQILNKIKEIAPSVTLDDFSLTNSLETSDPTTDISTWDGSGKTKSKTATFTITAISPENHKVLTGSITGITAIIKLSDSRVQLDQTVDKTSETPITLAFHQLEQVTSNEVNTQLGKSEKFKILLNNVVRSKNASASDIDYDWTLTSQGPFVYTNEQTIKVKIKSKSSSFFISGECELTFKTKGIYDDTDKKVVLSMSFKTKNNNLEFTTPKFHSYGLYGLTFRTQFYGGSLSLTYNTNDLRGINFDANGDSVDSTRQLFLKNHILKDAKISFDNQIYCYLKDHNIAGVGDNADQRYKNSPSTTANIADNTAPNWTSHWGPAGSHGAYGLYFYISNFWEAVYLHKNDDFHYSLVWKVESKSIPMFHQCGDKFQDNLDSSSFSFADPSYLFS